MRDIWTRLASCRAELETFAGAQRGKQLRQLLKEMDALTREGRRREETCKELLHQMALVLSATSVNRVLELTMDAMIRLSHAQRGFVLLSHPDGTQETAAARNWDRSHIKGAASKVSRHVVAAVLAGGRPVRLEDALHTPPFSMADSVQQLKLLSVLCVPIRTDDRVTGVLYLENSKASGVFTEETEWLIGEFAEHIGAALRNAEAFEDLCHHRGAIRVTTTRERGFEAIVGQSPEFSELLKRVATAARGISPFSSRGKAAPGRNSSPKRSI